MMQENVKRIPYGVSDFVEVVEQNQYYVDKTMYLPMLEQQPIQDTQLHCIVIQFRGWELMRMEEV